MSGLPDILRIPEGPEKLSLPGSEIPTREVVDHVVTKKTAKNRKAKANAGLVSSGEAEDADAEIAVIDEEPDVVEGLGKRTRRANGKYSDFWRHALCFEAVAPPPYTAIPGISGIQATSKEFR